MGKSSCSCHSSLRPRSSLLLGLLGVTPHRCPVALMLSSRWSRERRYSCSPERALAPDSVLSPAPARASLYFTWQLSFQPCNQAAHEERFVLSRLAFPGQGAEQGEELLQTAPGTLRMFCNLFGPASVWEFSVANWVCSVSLRSGQSRSCRKLFVGLG